MKKVLVVSDNVELVSKFQSVSKRISTEVAEFDYRYSIINKSPSELKRLGMSVVDMKDQKIINLITSTYDLIISAHCKQIFPKKLVDTVRCINIHPGLNPYNRGWFPQVFSILNKKPIGCTIHLMDEKIDHGDVIYQSEVAIKSCDTSLDVYNRVVSAEKELINNHLLDLVHEKYTSKKLGNDGNYNGIKDFKKLSQLDLSSSGTLAEHIDLLRALTHGDFNNAYFVDDQGQRVFVKINLDKE
ncbi:dTDP-4-amino-4,6-dideoxyglucose formyltransferase [Litorilituus lipolyticus]|uniref:dTDP-4-amino-4,6-dideoxyglucose formyltransferase n=1 Tax=Litorilituus lipolyticus TaxID=2491017 RepID=UPI001BAAC9D1|nr:dTDP-4-amino-4,6-dideoxyglucose formyltransferase [Litorilituus lipolyticus]